MSKCTDSPITDCHSTVILELKRQIRATPEATAVVCGSRVLTYGELDRLSDCVATGLRARGVQTGDRVGLVCGRSPETIAAIAGILKAGAVYVPLDPLYPTLQLKMMVEDAAPTLLMFDETGRAVARTLASDLLADLSDLVSDTPGRRADDVYLGPEDPAYIMFTSGSTGRPKGVVVPHRAIVRLVRQQNYMAFTGDQVFLHASPLAFDASTFEIWGALLNGGALAIVEELHPSIDAISSTIARHGVTTVWLTAGLFNVMAEMRPDAFKPLRYLLAGGDVLSPRHVRLVQDAAPNVQIINGYGPTENTTFTCCYRLPGPADPAAPLPIGTPIAHTTAHILDDSMRPVPAGETGMLWTGGAGVALGYLDSPELTRERFVPDPFGDDPQARLYRTGDLARLREDGQIEFLGRSDRQIKIAGRRIELDEIETALRADAAISDVAVLARTADSGEKSIAAFIKLHGHADPQAAKPGILVALRQRLPEHMVPHQLHFLDAFPLTPNGKVNRSALLAPSHESARPCRNDTSSAGTEVERFLQDAWRRLLGHSNFGMDENFFDLGGTSLGLIRLHAEILRDLSPDVSLIALFEHTTIRALASHLGSPPAAASASGDARRRGARQAAAMTFVRRGKATRHDGRHEH